MARIARTLLTASVGAITLVLVASAIEPSFAASPRNRRVTRTYVAPAAGIHLSPLAAPFQLCSRATTCVTFETRRRERDVRVRVRDASDTGPVLVTLAQDFNGDGLFGVDEYFDQTCAGSRFSTRRSEKARIPRPGQDVAVSLSNAQAGVTFYYGPPFVGPWVARCIDGGAVTHGQVTLSFSR